MKLIKIILLIASLIFIIFLAVAALAPRSFTIERKIVINATPEVIFNEVNSFQKWQAWSPWIKKDATIKNTYSGPEAGVGNKVNWTSKNSGTGSMEITESQPAQFVRNKLVLNDFTPFDAELTFTPAPGGTHVIWRDKGTLSYPWNIMTLTADNMMGPDLQSGLENLKKQIEGGK